MLRCFFPVCPYRLFGLAIAVLLAIGLIIGPTSPIPTADNRNTIGEDYVNIWAAASLTVSGDNETLYDITAYNQFLQSHIAPEFRTHNWSYSPMLQLWVWPFAFVPYEIGYVLWLSISFGLFMLSMRTLGISSMREHLFLLVSGASIWVIITGQNGFLTAALFIFGMALRQKRPFLSALAFALLTFKPHLGILVPFLLLAERNWRVIAMTIALVVAMAALTLAIWGIEPWIIYFTVTPDIQWIVFTEWEGLLRFMIPSPLMAAELLEVHFPTAILLQTAYSIGIFVTYILLLCRCRDEQLRLSALWICTLAILPYIFVYDFMLYHVALMLLWQKQEQYPFSTTPAQFSYTQLLLWLWPLLSFAIAMLTSLQLSPLLYPLLLAQLWRQNTRLTQS